MMKFIDSGNAENEKLSSIPTNTWFRGAPSCCITPGIFTLIDVNGRWILLRQCETISVVAIFPGITAVREVTIKNYSPIEEMKVK